MDSALEFLKGLPIKEILGAIVTVVSVGWAWFEKNKEKIQAIVVRIEKDRQDGWTNEEKEQLAIDIFFKEVRPKLPWYIRLIPKSILKKKIIKIIRGICSKAHELKGKVKKDDGK